MDYKAYKVNCNVIVTALDEEEAIEKVKEGMIEDITVIDVLTGSGWGG